MDYCQHDRSRPQQPKFDPESDSSSAPTPTGDGKISREEWSKFRESSPKLKEKAKSGDFLFDRLDTNKDGFLSLEEFKKINDFRGKKDADPKVEAKKDIAPEKPATADQIAFFEKNIRPVLIKECYSCHSASAEKLKGGPVARHAFPAWRQGGDTGPVSRQFPAIPKRVC